MRAHKAGPLDSSLKALDYGFAGLAEGAALTAGLAVADAAGAAFAGAGETLGPGEAEAAAAGAPGSADACGAAGGVFMSSRRRALSLDVFRCAYRIERKNVSARKMPA